MDEFNINSGEESPSPFESQKFQSTRKAGIFVSSGIKLLFTVAAIIVLSLDSDECGDNTYDLYNVLLTYAVLLGVDVMLTIPWFIYLLKQEMKVQALLNYLTFQGAMLLIYFALACYIIVIYSNDQHSCDYDNPALDTLVTVILILIFIALFMVVCVGGIICATHYRKASKEDKNQVYLSKGIFSSEDAKTEAKNSEMDKATTQRQLVVPGKEEEQKAPIQLLIED